MFLLIRCRLLGLKLFQIQHKTQSVSSTVSLFGDANSYFHPVWKKSLSQLSDKKSS